MFLVYPHAHFTALFLLSSLDHTDLLTKTFLTLTYTQEWPHIYLNIVLFIHVLVNCFFLAIFEGEREGKRERGGGCMWKHEWVWSMGCRTWYLCRPVQCVILSSSIPSVPSLMRQCLSLNLKLPNPPRLAGHTGA